MLIALTLAVLNAAPAPAPAAVVVLARRTELSAEAASDLIAEVEAALRAADVPLRDAVNEPQALATLRTCEGRRACLASRPAVQDAAVVVTVELARLLEDFAGHVEVLEVPSGEVLGQVDVVGPFAEAGPQLRAGMGPVIAAVQAELVRARSDVPTAMALAPEVQHVPEVPRWKHPEVLVTGGGAVAAGAVAVTFAVRGFAAQSRYDGYLVSADPPTFRVPRDQAEATRQSANQRFTVALVSAGISAALGVTAAVLAAD